MTNTNLTGIIAFSGLAGALLAQLISVVSAYLLEKRRYGQGIRNLYREKKLECGENFYFMNGERMDLIKKNTQYWKNWTVSRSQASRDHLNREMNKLIGYIEKINSENWKYNLINLYFEVSLNNERIHELNAQSHLKYLRVLDISEQIKKSQPADRPELEQQYALAIFDMCSHYEAIYEMLEQDMQTVKSAMLQEFRMEMRYAARLGGQRT